MSETVHTIGILGGGQLGRMLTIEAQRLGFGVKVIDKNENCPAAQVGAEQIVSDLYNAEAIDELAATTDVLTYEIEHTWAEYLEKKVEQGFDVQPSPTTLRIIQDKYLQKQMLANAGIPVAPFSGRLNRRDFPGGGPYIVKLRKGSYDGRGNLVVTNLMDPAITEKFGDQPVYAEKIVPFEKEIAIVSVRGRSGAIRAYQPVETFHKDNICHEVLMPAGLTSDENIQAIDLAKRVMRLTDGAGAFAFEMFVARGKVLLNEIAPRVHNSGHLTIEANETGQFEQHIRAVSGMPLGQVYRRKDAAAMINILGRDERPLSTEGLAGVLALRDTHPHFYGKDPRPGRKVGHITVLGEDRKIVRDLARQARARLTAI